MRFSVPQFIDIEDKLFGPLTFKQFMYLVGGGGVSYLLWRLLHPILAIPVILFIVSLSLALAFAKINRRPFVDTVSAAFSYMFKRKLYLWRQPIRDEKQKKETKKVGEEIAHPATASKSKIHNLAWSLDVLDPEENS